MVTVVEENIRYMNAGRVKIIIIAVVQVVLGLAELLLPVNSRER